MEPTKPELFCCYGLSHTHISDCVTGEPTSSSTNGTSFPQCVEGQFMSSKSTGCMHNFSFFSIRSKYFIETKNAKAFNLVPGMCVRNLPIKKKKKKSLRYWGVIEVVGKGKGLGGQCLYVVSMG